MGIKSYVRGVVSAALARSPEGVMVRPGLGDELNGMASMLARVTPEQARMILANAVAGDLASQHELFGMMLDTWPRLTKATREISSAVRRVSWQVQAAAEEGEQPSDQAQEVALDVRRALRSWRPRPGSHELTFEDTVEHLLDARWRGTSVAELLWHQTAHGWMPRAGQHLTPKHYGWDSQGSSLGLIGEIDGKASSWQPFVGAKFLVAMHRARAGIPGSTALFRPLVPYWIGRTFGWQWLLRTAQLFGVPLRWATYEQGHEDVGAQVASMLRNLGAAGWAAFPAGTTMEIKEAAQNVRDNPQALLMELADQAADLLILGQTLSGTSQPTGLGAGTAGLHGQVRREVLEDAAWWVADILSYQLAPAVIELNRGACDPLLLPAVRPDFSVPADPKTEAERLEILSRVGLRLPRRWAYETTGIPEPEEGEAVIEQAQPAQMTGFPAAAGIENKTPAAPGEGEDASRPKESRNGLFAGVRGLSYGRAALQAAAFAGPSPVLERFFEDLTGTTARWLAPVEEPLMRLLELAQDDKATEADFAKALDDARKTLPELFSEVNTDIMADALRKAMASELINGAAEAAKERRFV